MPSRRISWLVLVIVLAGCKGTQSSSATAGTIDHAKGTPSEKTDLAQVMLPATISLEGIRQAIAVGAGVPGQKGCHFIWGLEPLPGRAFRVQSGALALDGRIYCGDIWWESSPEASKVAMEFRLECCTQILLQDGKMILWTPPGFTHLDDELLTKLEEARKEGLHPEMFLREMLMFAPRTNPEELNSPRSTTAFLTRCTRIARALGPVGLPLD